MATTWGKPSLSMVARAAFLRSRKNAACSSGLSWICCRRLVAIRAASLACASAPRWSSGDHASGYRCGGASLKLADPSRSCAREDADEQSADAVPDDLYADAQEDKRGKTHHHTGPGRTKLLDDPISVTVAEVYGDSDDQNADC